MPFALVPTLFGGISRQRKFQFRGLGMQEFFTDEELAARMREARDELTTVAARLDETARALGPEPEPEVKPEPMFPVRRRVRHKQDRLPI